MFIIRQLRQKFKQNDFKYFSQEFDNNVLDLVKQEGLYPYDYFTDFEKFKKELPGKEKFYSSLTDRKITRNMNMLFTFGKELK